MDNYDQLLEMCVREENLKVWVDASNFGNQRARSVIKRMLRQYQEQGLYDDYDHLTALLSASMSEWVDRQRGLE